MEKLFIKKSKIIRNEKLSLNTYLLEFYTEIKFHPTQFILVDTFPKKFLLKPFCISNYDEKNSKAFFIYRVIGEGTEFLSLKKRGDYINFLGPFGNYNKFYKLENEIHNKKIILAAGGSGISSIIFIYKFLMSKGFKPNILYGEKDKKYVINLRSLGINNYQLCTDNGSVGKKGFLTSILEKNNDFLKYSDDVFIISCGPKGMLLGLTKICQENKVLSCYALLEEYMCCGLGICRSCVVEQKNNSEYLTVCKDGPLFNLLEIKL